jgi:hypothetical protein
VLSLGRTQTVLSIVDDLGKKAHSCPQTKILTSLSTVLMAAVSPGCPAFRIVNKVPPPYPAF